MYHSKVVLLIWGVVFVAAALAALYRKKYAALGMISAGAGIVGVGVLASAMLASEAGALVLSICLLAAVVVAGIGITRIFRDQFPDEKEPKG